MSAIKLDDHRPHVVVKVASGDVHVLPLILLEEIAEGRRPFDHLDLWPDIMRAVMNEWLSDLKRDLE